MKRIVVEPRKNITKACTFCKTRKRKCDGQVPCSFCLLKNKAESCSYDFVDKRSIRYTKEKPKDQNEDQTDSTESPLSSTSTSTSTSQSSISKTPSILEFEDPYFYKSKQKSLNQNQINNHESLRFIGESSPLTLLNQTKQLFQNLDLSRFFRVNNNHPDQKLHKIHLSQLNLSKSQFLKHQSTFEIVDSPTSNIKNSNSSSNSNLFQLPDREIAEELTQLFLASINQVMYIFQDEFLNTEILSLLYDQEIPLYENRYRLCQFYLIVAISVIYQKAADSSTTKLNSEEYFNRSLKILESITEDANLSLVQIHMLLFAYHSFTNRRNASWLNLGQAIRISQSLGLNRKRANLLVKDKDSLTHRRKLWRSLYIFDRIISINLGRPLSINDKIWDDMNTLPIENSNNLRSVCQNELMKLTKLKGEIYEKFYYGGNNQNILINVAYKMAHDLNMWSNNLPRQLRAEHLLKLEHGVSINCDHNMAYNYHSLLFLHLIQLDGIMLLTKPPFHFHLMRYINSMVENLKDPQQETIIDELTVSSNLIRLYSEACLKSSVFTIRVCWYFMKNKIYPFYSYTLVNNVFNAALMIGLTVLLDVIKTLESKVKKHDSFQERLAKYEEHYRMLHVSVIILDKYSDFCPFANNSRNIITDLIQSFETTINALLHLFDHEGLNIDIAKVGDVFNFDEENPDSDTTEIELGPLSSLISSLEIVFANGQYYTGGKETEIVRDGVENYESLEIERERTIKDLEKLSSFMFEWEESNLLSA